MFTRILKSSSGFSLVELMVGGTVLVGVGLAAATLMKNQRLAQRDIELQQKLNAFHTTLTKVVTNVNNCHTTFSDSANTANVLDIQMIKLADPNTNPGDHDVDNVIPSNNRFITEGSFIEENSEFGSSRSTRTWIVDNLWFPTPINKDTAPNQQLLEVVYRLNPALGTKTVNYKILLNLKFEPDGTLQRCIDPASSSVDNFQKTLCAAFNPNNIDSSGYLRIYNEQTQKCEITSTGLNHGVKNCNGPNMIVRGIRSDGTMNCMPATEGMETDLADPSHDTPCTGTRKFQLVFDRSTGKVKIECAP